MLLRHAVRHRRSDLPHLLHRRRHALGQHQLPEDPHRASGQLRRQIRRLERDRPLRDRAVPGDVVGLHRQRPVGLVEPDQGLAPPHAASGWVDGPRDPPLGLSRRSHEGDREASGGGVVGEVQRGVEIGEVEAVGEGAVRGKSIGGAPTGGGDGGGNGEEEGEKEGEVVRSGRHGFNRRKALALFQGR